MDYKLTGLAGAHRVGKSFLRDHLVSVTGGKQLDFSVSEVLKLKTKYSSAKQDYGFEDRINIQKILFAEFEKSLWRHTANIKLGLLTQSVVQDRPPVLIYSDRTPLDLVAYAVSNLKKYDSDYCRDWLRAYTEDCIALTTEYYDTTVLVQPGIPFVPDAKSGPPEQVDELNGIFLNLFINPNLNIKKAVMPTDMLDVGDRTAFVLGVSGHA